MHIGTVANDAKVLRVYSVALRYQRPIHMAKDKT